jgi:hypothetical protein
VIFRQSGLMKLYGKIRESMNTYGKMQTDNGNQNVAAYVDFELKP